MEIVLEQEIEGTMSNETGPGTLADMLRTERENLGLSQREMADEMRVTRSAVSQWELGALGYPMKPEVVDRLVELTGKSEIDWLRAQGFRLNLGEARESRMNILRAANLTDQEKQLLSIFRQLSPDYRSLVLRIVPQLQKPQPPADASPAKNRRHRN